MGAGLTKRGEDAPPQPLTSSQRACLKDNPRSSRKNKPQSHLVQSLHRGQCPSTWNLQQISLPCSLGQERKRLLKAKNCCLSTNQSVLGSLLVSPLECSVLRFLFVLSESLSWSMCLRVCLEAEKASLATAGGTSLDIFQPRFSTWEPMRGNNRASKFMLDMLLESKTLMRKA